MDASRLLALLELLEQDFASGYLSELKELAQLYSQAQSQPGENFQPQIQEKQKKLLNTLRKSPTDDLVPTRRAMLAKLNAERFVGSSAAHEIEQIIASNAGAGPVGVHQALESYRAELGEFRKNVGQIRTGLVALNVKAATLGPDEFEVGISIPDQVTKRHLGSTTRVLNDWNFILRGFVELSGAGTREIELRGTSTGSPLDFFASLPNEWSAAAIVFAIDRLARLYERVLKILVLRKQLKAEGAPTAEAEMAKKHEAELLEKELTHIREELLARAAELSNAPKGGRREEIGIHVARGLELMARYLNVGVTMEVSFPPPEAIAKPEASDEEADQTELEEQRATAIEARRERIRQGAAIARLKRTDEAVFQLPAPSMEEEADAETPGDPKASGKPKK